MSTTPVTQGGKPGIATFLRSTRVSQAVVPAALTALACVFYWKLIYGGLILASYDLVVFFYPLKAYTSSSIAAGRLPLWNPDLFMGVPYLANIQGAFFYPPNLADLALAPPRAVAVSAVSHVVLAGLFMYVFLRFSVRLTRPASFLGGLVFMFSGFLGQQVGHINQLNASVWLPLLLASFDWAHRGRSLQRALLAGIILAFTLLAGHTQETFLTLSTFAGYVAFRLVLLPSIDREDRYEAPSRIRKVLHKVVQSMHSRAFLLAAFGATVAVGATLAAVQLLPTYELTDASIRSTGLPYGEAVSFSLPPFLVVRSLLPGYLTNPFSEYIGYIGAAPLLLAILAVVRLPKSRFMWFAVVLAAVALILAVGGYEPFFRFMYEHVPGFKLFRVPARWLYVYTFAMSLLVALGADVLSRERNPHDWTFRSRMRTSLLFVGALFILAAWLWSVRLTLLPAAWETPALWLLFGAVAALLILIGLWKRRRLSVSMLLGCLFSAELFLAAQGLEFNQPLPQDLYSLLPAPIPHLLTQPAGSRLLSTSHGTFMPGDEQEVVKMLEGALSDREINDFLVTLKYSQTLAPNVPLRLGLATIDGYDGGVLPLERYAQLKQVVAEKSRGGASPAGQADASLRLQLGSLPDAEVLGELGVKYVVADKTRDLWHEGIYYDLSMAASVKPGAPVILTGVPDFRSTSLRLLSHLEGAADVPPGATAAQLTVEAHDGSEQVFPLRVGAESAWRPELGIGPMRDLAAARAMNLPLGRSYLSASAFRAPTPVRTVRVELMASSGAMVIDGLTLVDDRLAASEPMVSNGKLSLTYSGDVKVYRILDAKEELYLTRRIAVARTPTQTMELLSRDLGDKVVFPETPNVDWRVLASMEEGQADETDRAQELSQDTRSQPPAGARAITDSVQILADLPELRRAAVMARQPAFLVFTESYYPGWQARLDGRPAELLRANHLFQAIFVPAGNHVAEFRYDATSFRLGLAISAAASAAVVGAFLLAVLARLARWGRPQ